MIFIVEYGVQTTLYFPLIDFGATDFESTPVSHASGDSQFSEDGAAFGNTTNAFAHEGNGIYSLVLEGSELSGKMIVVTIIDQTGPKEWEDQSLVIMTVNSASALLPVLNVNVEQISDDATAADNLELDYDGTGLARANSTIGTCTTNTDMVSAAPTAAANADAVWNEAVADHQTNSTYGNAFDDATVPTLAAISATANVAIADAILTRDLDNVEASAPIHSLCSAGLKLVSRFVASTGITYRTNGSTTHMTQTPTTDATADPVTELAAGA
tara:strand:+ start:1304 stop:2116 length:813 start_codon:yes stop_codon:yes gene_type:complete